MERREFISLADKMLYEAVGAVREDMMLRFPVGIMDEPSYVASIVTKFPVLMNKKWGKSLFGGCFIHQSPYVRMETKGNNRCETGDLLVLCKQTTDGIKRFNSTLFQVKRDKSKKGIVRPDKKNQLKLYTKWPKFSFETTLPNHKKRPLDIQPKAVNLGAQYMFINNEPYPNNWSCYDCRYCKSYPVVYTHTIPSARMVNNKEFSFGSFLWNFIHWQNGRPISDSAIADDDWSRFIWELIERSKIHVFNLDKINVSKMHRTNGDFFSFMTNTAKDKYENASYKAWIELKTMEFAEHHNTYVSKYFEKYDRRSGKVVGTEEYDGISILFIDLDQLYNDIE